MPDHEAALRRLSLNDQAFVESVISIEPDKVKVSNLDPKTHALVRLGALVALDAAPASYQWNVGMALAAGASVEEIVGVLIAVAPVVGLARTVSAAPELALAIGYDIDGALAGTKKWRERAD
jgi:alkylhydroperoxidase/carboxymuconolactone decarboxylase family protein YurZ